jgi:hypothetical protein
MAKPTELTSLLQSGDGVPSATPYTYLGSQFSARFGESFFDVKIKKVFLDANYCCNRHGIYEVSVRQGKHNWIVEKRYRDFHALYQESVQVSAELPPRTWLPSTDPIFLEYRREKLETFLICLLTTLSESASIKFGTPIARFLELKPCF